MLNLPEEVVTLLPALICTNAERVGKTRIWSISTLKSAPHALPTARKRIKKRDKNLREEYLFSLGGVFAFNTEKNLVKTAFMIVMN
jgi:hypothetical protein